MTIDRPKSSRLRLTHLLLLVFPLLLAIGANNFISETSTPGSASIRSSGMASRLLQFFRFSPSSTMGSVQKDAPLFKNLPAPGVEEYYPLNQPEIGTVLSKVPFAERIKRDVEDVAVGSVGLITSPQQAEKILQDGQADVIFLARELLRHADFPLYAAQELGVAVKPANQNERAWTRMLTPKA
ncbi:hypothetical protein BDV93DRAFT_511700 [Ceratobasidium sp. AG-I]|nr:hypothetical protein BDV93DRAFT_511700 [Ceratobasidium sp. AG-I]